MHVPINLLMQMLERKDEKEFNLQSYLMSFRNGNDPDVYNDITCPHAKRINCQDEFSISVQANYGAYCLPRHNIATWTHVECGFPSAVPEFILEYAEDEKCPTETVYGYVPVELVEKLIKHHGGIKL